MVLPNSMEKSPSWEAKRFSASQEIPRVLRELEGSLPHSQQPATCPYSEPDKSSPRPPPVLLHEDSFQYYPLIYACVFYVVSFPQVSLHLLSPYVPLAPTTSSFLVLSSE